MGVPIDKNAVVEGVTETLYDYAAFVDEARLDDFVALFCEDGCFDPGHAFTGRARIRKLAASTPGTLMCFDLLVDQDGKSLVDLPLGERRERLAKLFSKLGDHPGIELSPFTPERRQAEQWMREMGVRGLDGIVAKRTDECYHSGERVGMVKVKSIRTADCVVGGFRYASKCGVLGSLLLGLYNDEGKLDHVGFTSSFSREQRAALLDVVKPVMGPPGFTGKAPGGPSRWSTERSGEWEPLQPKLVCEVSYDHFSGGRFRHGTKFLRWRPEKKPTDCSFAQLAPARRTAANHDRMAS